ncbi:MAG: hypothetical protein KKA73_01495 [Chloroflexi bacterium]|nr:hypothetical protein [Chloroflexota bacterium]MBU1746338.1 hypothetical protein [Chloroflexota bacterium]
MDIVVILLAVLLVVAIGAVGYYFGRGGRRPSIEAATIVETGKSWAGATTDKTSEWAGAVRDRLPIIGRSRKGAEQFVAWATTLPEAEPAFKDWLQSLTPAETDALWQGAADFGAGLNIDLAWLLDGQMEDDPALKQEIEKAMTLYCQAYWKSILIRDDAEVFAAFRAWQEAPQKHKELGRRLFAHLVDMGAISMPTTLHLAPEKERWEYSVKAIRDFAEKDRLAFLAAFKEALTTPPDAEPEPVEEPPAATKSRRSKATAAS